MKKALAVIIALIIVLSAVPVAAVNPQSGKNIFMSLGDSIAQGAGLSDRKTGAYGAIVSSKRNYEFINDAVGGYTSSDLLNQLTDYRNANYCANDISKADIICISIGGNDILKDPDISSAFSGGDYVSMYSAFILKSPTIFATLKSNISKIVSRIKELNPDAIILIQNMYNPIFVSDTLRALGSIGINALNSAINEANNGSYYVPDVYSSFNSASMMNSDGIHPNESGHRAIADAIDKFLAGVLDNPKCLYAKVSGIYIDETNKTIYGLPAGKVELSDYVGVNGAYTTNRCSAATGAKLNVYLKNVLCCSYTAVLFGDVNGDGWYDSSDANTVNYLANGLLSRSQVGEAAWLAADCNHDGFVNSTDAAVISRAGEILSKVDRSKSISELMKNSDFVEYLRIINQNPAGISAPVVNPSDGNTGTQTTGINIIQIIIKVLQFFIKLIESIIALL